MPNNQALDPRILDHLVPRRGDRVSNKIVIYKYIVGYEIIINAPENSPKVWERSKYKH